MNRKISWSILAVIFLIGLTSCSSSSHKTTPPPVVAITATSGSGQSAVVGAAFTNPLTATVTTGGTPTANVSVTFTAPAAEPNGTFAGAVATATAMTNASGVATSPVFTAGTTAGTYTVTASTTGATANASFSLTNTAGAAANLAATSGGGQSATISTAFANPLVATVTDGDGNGVAGQSVTFTAPPATGASGLFADGGTPAITDTEMTDASGKATSTVFTANATVGGPYNVVATSGTLTAVNFALTNTPVVVVGSSNYSFYLSGQEFINAGPNLVVLAGAVSIDASGNVLAGEQDYNDATGITSPQPAGDTITGGTLTVDGTTGQGTLTLITNNAGVGVAGTETLGVQFVNTNHALIVQFDGTATSSGSMDLQTLPSTPSGGFAFTTSGVDSGYNPTATAGVFTITGTAVAGVTDQNDNGTVTLNQAFTGTLSAADTFGRGSLAITGSSGLINYYVVGPEVVRIINVDTTDASVGTAFGQGAGTFSNASLGASVLAMANNPFSGQNSEVGQFTTSSTSSNPADFAGVAEGNELGNAVATTLASPITGTYTIATNGYGSLTVGNGGLGDAVSEGIYMTDPTLNLSDPNNPTGGGGGLVLSLDAVLAGTTGVLVPQTDTTTASFAGNYLAGIQDFNDFSTCTLCEFDVVAQGTVTAGVLSLTGDVSDPFLTLGVGGTGLYTGSTFTSTPLADATNPGRYSMLQTNTTPNPLAATINGVSGSFNVTLYQASGTQLFWLEFDNKAVWFGPLEQQGSLANLPAVRKAAAKTQSGKKH